MAMTASLFMGAAASAAEQVTITYGPFARSIPVADLRTFVDTGETTPMLTFLLRVSGQKPEIARRVLGQEVAVSTVTLDRSLNSLPGEYALFQAGRILHGRSDTANIEALRSAAVLAASDDGQVSVMELLETYPLETLYVDGAQLAQAAQQVGEIRDRLGGTLELPLALVTDFLADIICDCDAAPALESAVGSGLESETAPNPSPPLGSAPGFDSHLEGHADRNADPAIDANPVMATEATP
ncbi:MAG: alpha/beta hydrolase [Prochlorothrix sp.]|nr:alpha/beta hydrolase [Prochlorothrix sp.]